MELTEVVALPGDPGRRHQAWEYMGLVGAAGGDVEPALPGLSIPRDVMERCRERLGGIPGGRWIALVPGAAYGPAKRWPEKHFMTVGRELLAYDEAGIVLLGSSKEAELCVQIAEGVGKGAVNMAGATSLEEFAAFLALCSVAITNDSGGMHLAAAAGTRVVAVFGLTDPVQTGPLGQGHRIVSGEGGSRSRDIERDSVEARKVMESVRPEEVIAAARELLAEEG